MSGSGGGRAGKRGRDGDDSEYLPDYDEVEAEADAAQDIPKVSCKTLKPLIEAGFKVIVTVDLESRTGTLLGSMEVCLTLFLRCGRSSAQKTPPRPQPRQATLSVNDLVDQQRLSGIQARPT